MYRLICQPDDEHCEMLLHDLQLYGLNELGRHELLLNPAELIRELYLRSTIQDTFGKQVHELASGIAKRAGLAITEIHAGLAIEWLVQLRNWKKFARHQFS
jgi:hypothetical protein